MKLVRYFRPSDFVCTDSARDFNPAVDVYERGDDLVVRVELPGVEKEEINIGVEEHVLTIDGERKRDSELKEENAYRLERAYGSFVRRFRLPDAVDVENISAKFRNGVLEVTLPKADEAKPRKIEIQAA